MPVFRAGSNVAIGSKPAAASGGGVTAPSIQTNLTLVEGFPSLDIQIQNLSLNNPAVVELSFANSAMQATSWDDGDALTPSYALDPSSTRDVTFVRGTGAPPYGTDVAETVTATLADGSTVTSSVSVEGPLFTAAIQAIGYPTHEFRMDAVDGNGDLVNTGGQGFFGGYNPSLNNCAATASFVDGFDGYVEMDGGADSIKSDLVNAPLAYDLLRNWTRSYVFVWDNTADLGASKYHTIATTTALQNAWGYIETDATDPVFTSQHLWSSGTTKLNSTNGTNDHPTGVAEDFLTTAVPGPTRRRCIMAVIWDHPALEATIRWKCDGHGDGHTYITDPAPDEGTAGALNPFAWAGWTTGAVESVQWLYIGVIDTVMTSDQFDSLAIIIP